MLWILQSFLGTFMDATLGQMVHAFGSSETPRSLPPWQLPAPHPASARDTMDLQDGDSLQLVRYTLVSVRRGEERILPGGSGEILVRSTLTPDGLTARVIADYLETGRRIAKGEERHLRVSCQVLAQWPLGCKNQKTNALEGIRDALREVAVHPAAPRKPAAPSPSILAWDGTGTPSQVGGRGRVTLTKTWNGTDYDVTLEGTLAIQSRAYGYVRHGLPLGYLPAGAAPYPCEVQKNARAGDTSGVDNYGGRGVHVRRGDLPGYEGRAVLWFPERHYNGEYTLRCMWRTVEDTEETR